LFWNKKVNSDEYIELHKRIEVLRIFVESLKLELELNKKKLRTRAKLDETDTPKDIYSGVLLPEDGIAK